MIYFKWFICTTCTWKSTYRCSTSSNTAYLDVDGQASKNADSARDIFRALCRRRAPLVSAVWVHPGWLARHQKGWRDSSWHCLWSSRGWDGSDTQPTWVWALVWLLPWHMCFPVMDANLMTLKKTLRLVTLPETAKSFGNNIKKSPSIEPLCVGHAWPLVLLQCIHSYGERS